MGADWARGPSPVHFYSRIFLLITTGWGLLTGSRHRRGQVPTLQSEQSQPVGPQADNQAK